MGRETIKKNIIEEGKVKKEVKIEKKGRKDKKNNKKENKDNLEVTKKRAISILIIFGLIYLLLILVSTLFVKPISIISSNQSELYQNQNQLIKLIEGNTKISEKKFNTLREHIIQVNENQVNGNQRLEKVEREVELFKEKAQNFDKIKSIINGTLDSSDNVEYIGN